MPSTGPFTRVSDALEHRRDRERRPVDGTTVRLGALVVFLALVVLMVLSAGPSVAATADADPGSWSGVINLAPILFWAAVGIAVVTRIVLARRSTSSTADPTRLSRVTPARPTSSPAESGEQATAA
ncbi:hypothetical protein [Salsipaludibacter albus]|uniref:hypothetical protein n=1 Tax=Salsipaludibacter albus TaxID=2849650 RepID=UPI001EE3B35D|nr:hypothetical protein [Salsipaludibacter albus]MBY5163878.1 hypothetical protein [Salsipaludibacter albus]